MIRGRDQFGYEAQSDEQTFTTLEDTTPPEITNVRSESNVIGSGEASRIQLVISWQTNEPATSQVEYGPGLTSSEFPLETQENAELVQDHLVVIPDLDPAKTFHIRVVSKDKAQNETKSDTYSTLTARSRKSFLQIIVENLENTFSWVGEFVK